MVGLVYNLLMILAIPVMVIYFPWRILVAKKSNESWRENLGALPRLAYRPKGKKLIWLHAVSVGEVVASLPIQNELRRLLPDATILVTTITQTGNAMARKSAKSADVISYYPLDYPLFVTRALNRVRPDVIVMMEAEIWPNFLAQARRRGIPTILANGRISDRAMHRGKSWRWLMSWAYSRLDYCCMQTQTDADRISELGARPESVRVLGSTKFDQEGGKLPSDAVLALRESFGLHNEPVFVAGSTNPGEDEPILDAFAELAKSSNGLRLIIAPRQIDRAEEIQAMAETRGLACVRRSKKETFAQGAEVLILDTFGELGSTYAVANIAIVGGTLIRKGGHSIIQPILQGKPVFFGPHTFKTRDVAQMAISAQVGFEVQDAQDLAVQAGRMLADVDRRAQIDAACQRLVAENKGTSARCAALIAKSLGAETGGTNAA